MQPLLSIVIANYNYGRFLEEAIRSVISQDMGSKVELIICDAASTDNSVEVIKKFGNYISWWCSEPDGGQSAAFNKGFSHAKGRFLTWLNADDVLLPGAISGLEVAISNNPTCEWFVSGVLWLDPNMNIIRCGPGRPFSYIRYKTGDVSVWGPSSFFTKKLLDSVGGVDERFFYTMDTDLWLRFACKANARYVPFSDYVWGLRMHPDAKMSGHNFASGTGVYQGGLTGSSAKQLKQQLQLEKERNWKLEYFKPVKGNLLLRICSASWGKVVRGYIDSLSYKGKHYKEMFK